MSLLLVAACVAGYVIVVTFVIALLMASKQADEATERELRALQRPPAPRAPARFVREDGAERERAGRRVAVRHRAG